VVVCRHYRQRAFRVLGSLPLSLGSVPERLMSWQDVWSAYLWGLAGGVILGSLRAIQTALTRVQGSA